MHTFDNIDEIRAWCRSEQRLGKTAGLVPTMGALHEGHLSLVRQAKQHCDLCVATIFVNPTQFAASEDLSRYPRPLDRDLELLQAEHVDAVFLPTASTMYPDGFATYVMPPPVAMPLEGRSRPEHFRGVTTVVLKLFQIVPADRAFFGQKDYQQLRVIEDMTRDLNLSTEVIACSIVRETDGLAMSSRNRYLSADERRRALSLSRALKRVKALVDAGHRDLSELQAVMTSELAECDTVDYAVIAKRSTLEIPDELPSDPSECVALIAARLGTTRLIDNLIL